MEGVRREGGPFYESNDFEAEKLYMRDLRKVSTMNKEEEKELAEGIARGDGQSRKKMIELNLRLVVKIARRYTSQGLSILDLIEEGNIGLIRAVEKFDLSRECRFSTYATWWIKQSIERAIGNFARIIRLPTHVSARVRKIGRIVAEYKDRQGHEPSPEEIARLTQIPLDFITNLFTIITKTYSLDTFVDEDEKLRMEDMLAGTTFEEPLSMLEQSKRIEEVASWLDLLRDDEKRVIILRFGIDGADPQTLEAIGKTFGVSRERIRQIESKGIIKLRKVVKRKHIGRETI